MRLLSRSRRTSVLLVATIAALLASSVASPVRAAIEAGPIVNPANGHTYYLLTQTNWTAAEAEANGLGGDLATVVDDAENSWLWETFAALGNGPFWIGLTDAAQEGSFVWASGKPVTYLNWWTAGGQPSNDGGVENYTELNNYVWNDNVESALLAGIVEVVPHGLLQVQVDWSAAVDGAHGTGTIAGSLGVFDVADEGLSFPIPADGSLIATASGFTSGFANQDYALSMGIGGLAIRFDSLDPIATSLVATEVSATYAAVYSSLATCAPEVCRVLFEHYVGSGLDSVRAGKGPFQNGIYTEYYSTGPTSFSYSVVPEPGTLINGAGAAGVLLTLNSLKRGRRAAARRARSR